MTKQLIVVKGFDGPGRHCIVGATGVDSREHKHNVNSMSCIRITVRGAAVTPETRRGRRGKDMNLDVIGLEV